MMKIKVRGDEKLEVEVGEYYLFGSPDIGDDTQKRVANVYTSTGMNVNQMR